MWALAPPFTVLGSLSIDFGNFFPLARPGRFVYDPIQNVNLAFLSLDDSLALEPIQLYAEKATVSERLKKVSSSCVFARRLMILKVLFPIVEKHSFI